MQTSTHHGKLKLHLERHMYKRGRNKGDAPMGRRGKDHYRIIDRGTHLAVRFWNTDIIRAYPDGKVMADCNGWSDRITTKMHLNNALPSGWWIGSTNFRSESQLCINTSAGRYRYYDGITFDADGKPTTELRPLLARRIDKEQVAELNQAMNEHGFKEMFKVLWGACEYEESHTRIGTNNHDWRWVRNKLDLFYMPDVHADKWRPMVAYFAFEERWVRDPQTGNHKKTFTKLSPSTTWSNLMRWVKKDMYQSIETEVYEISK
jgi:hypothetical protein